MSTNSPHRYNDTELPGSHAFFRGTDRSPERDVLDAGSRGGQYGWAYNTFEYVSEDPHLEQQGWMFVLNTPEFFSRFNFGTELHKLCKAMFENRAMEWQGPTDKVDFDFAEQKFGGRTLSVPSGGTRTIGPLSLKMIEVKGEPFTAMIKIWGIWGGYDTDLGYPRMVILPTLQRGDILIDRRTASVITFNTSENLRDIAHSALTVGVFPRGTVQVGIRRNKDEGMQMRTIDLEFTGMTEFDTMATREIARKFLHKLPFFNPDARRAEAGFTKPSATVESLRDTGVYEQMKRESAKVADNMYVSG